MIVVPISDGLHYASLGDSLLQVPFTVQRATKGVEMPEVVRWLSSLWWRY